MSLHKQIGEIASGKELEPRQRKAPTRFEGQARTYGHPLKNHNPSVSRQMAEAQRNAKAGKELEKRSVVLPTRDTENFEFAPVEDVVVDDEGRKSKALKKELEEFEPESDVSDETEASEESEESVSNQSGCEEDA